MRAAFIQRIQPYQQAYQRWLHNKSEAEQWLIRILIIAALGLLLYIGLWSPVQQAHQRAQGQLQQAHSLYTLLQQQGSRAMQAARAQGINAAGALTHQGDIQSAIQATAQQHQVVIRRIESDGQQGVRIWVDDAPFDQVLQYVQTLKTSHGIAVHQISLEAGARSGRVNFRALLV